MESEKETKHIIRYGTVAEKVHLEKALSSYDYLCINANMAAYVSNAISRFIVDNFFSNKEKGYFIDPITYAFQDKIDLLFSKSSKTGEINIRKSFDKLIEFYGLPKTIINRRTSIETCFFDNDINFSGFVEKVLDFQYNLVYDYIENQGLKEYLDYVVAEKTANMHQLRPCFLVAPYFYINNQSLCWEKWLDINIELIKSSVNKSKNDYGDSPVFAQIVINKSILTDENALKKIKDKYSGVKCNGYTIWVDDLNENTANQELLKGFICLIKGLKHRPVYNMYGGYFSILLSHKSLGLMSGVSHGLEYGESRMVYPVGGGIPVSKYYYLPLHQRIDFTKAFYLLEYAGVIDTCKENWGDSEKYYKDICNCSQCKSVIKSDMINFVEYESRDFYEIYRNGNVVRRKKASPETKDNCIYHYLLCKKIEFLRVKNKSLSQLLDELTKNEDLYKGCDCIMKGEIDYISIWKKVIEEEKG